MTYNIYLVFINGFTEGQNIFNLKYDLDNISKWKRLLRIVLFYFSKFLLPYLFIKVENYINMNISDDDFESNKRGNFSRVFLKICHWVIKIIKFLLSLVKLINFFLFISTNKFPYLINKIFKFDYVRMLFKI
jgi:hypothetical protein